MCTSTDDNKEMIVYLQEFVNHKPGNKYNINGSKALIGRNPKAEIPVIASNVSRNHAVVELSMQNGWCITDNKSINGVYLNGERVDPALPHPLKHGSKIFLGPPAMSDRYFEFYVNVTAGKKQSLSQTAMQVDLAKPGCSTSNQSTSNRNDKRCLRKRALRNQSASAKEKNDLEISSDSSLEERMAAIDNILKKNDAIDERIKRILNESDEKLIGTHESFKECSASLLSKANIDCDLVSWSDWSGDDALQSTPCQASQSKKNARKKKISSGSEDTVSASQEFAMSREELQKLQEKVAQLEKQLKERDQTKVDLEEQLKAKETLLQKHEKEKKEAPTEQAGASITPTKTLQEKVDSEIANQFGQILESELTCIICTELFIKATTLECSHTFCQDCLATWRKSKKVCPICRTSISGATHSLVIDGFIEKLVEKLSPEDQAKRKQVLTERVKPIPVRRKPPPRVTRARRGRLQSRAVQPSPAAPVVDVQPIDHQYTDIDIEIDPVEILLDFQESDIFSTMFSGDIPDISVSDDDEEEDDSDDSSVEGHAFYGGYGRCYNCGRRGHWANGCPDF